MSDFKITGACSLCDELCFEVLAVQSDNDRFPGEPKRLGSPTEDATRITFLLLDGSRGDFTFCGKCAEILNPGHYVELWRKNMRSYARAMSETSRPWFNTQFQNGILGEIGRKLWKEVGSNG